MTEDQIRKYNRAAEEGTIPDAENPLFLFSITHTKLLVKLLSGKLDVEQLVRMELRNRGLNDKGKWIGFGNSNYKVSKKKSAGKRMRH